MQLKTKGILWKKTTLYPHWEEIIVYSVARDLEFYYFNEKIKKFIWRDFGPGQQIPEHAGRRLFIIFWRAAAG
ncbi:MAG: hypothetical protein H6669_04155 [Ardenticatenaceae bacterium]|nr:hypothetical protein [Ardenticatenaceae bacterium]